MNMKIDYFCHGINFILIDGKEMEKRSKGRHTDLSGIFVRFLYVWFIGCVRRIKLVAGDIYFDDECDFCGTVRRVKSDDRGWNPVGACDLTVFYQRPLSFDECFAHTEGG